MTPAPRPGATVLGLVEGFVGLLDQALRAGVALSGLHTGHSQADRDPAVQRRALVRHRQRFNRRTHAFSSRLNLLGWCAVQQHDEFFAAIAGHQVTRPAHALAQGLGHSLQAGVSSLMAIAVVVLLEVVHIQHQDGHPFVVVHRTRPHLCKELVKVTPVGHLGQGVGARHPLQLVVGHRQLRVELTLAQREQVVVAVFVFEVVEVVRRERGRGSQHQPDRQQQGPVRVAELQAGQGKQAQLHGIERQRHPEPDAAEHVRVKNDHAQAHQIGLRVFALAGQAQVDVDHRGHHGRCGHEQFTRQHLLDVAQRLQAQQRHAREAQHAQPEGLLETIRHHRVV
jgi:hypothetical protein